MVALAHPCAARHWYVLYGSKESGCLSILILLSTISASVSASDISDYVYANYLGSGVYTAAGRSVQVIGIPFSFPRPIHTNEQLKVIVKVPVTVGFYDFSSDGPLPQGVAEHVGTMTIVPSLNFEYQVSPVWELAPFIDLGLGQNFSSGSVVGIYAAGVHSNYDFTWLGKKFRLGNRLLYAGHTAADTNFAAFDTGLEINQPLGGKVFSKELDVKFYAVNFLYLQNLKLLRYQKAPIIVSMQNEIGFSFGLKHSVNRPALKIPRLGIGYRFGGGVTAVRIVFGAPF